MKFFIPFIVFVLSNFLLTAQSGVVKYHHKMAEDNFIHEGTLTFNSSESKYVYKQIEGDFKLLQEGFKAQRVFSDSIGHFFYRDKVNQKYIERLFCDKQKFILTEYQPLKWKLTKNEKNISGYICKEAVASHRGRKYTAWFTQEIPVDVGPWKLCGLPGLVLEAYDSKQDVHFQVASIKLDSKQIDIEVEQDGIMASFSDFRKAQIIAFQERKKRMRAKAELLMATSNVEIEIESPNKPVFTEQ